LNYVKTRKCSANQSQLRANLLNSTAEFVQRRQWLLKIPYDIRDEAAKDLVQAYKTNIAKNKKNNTSKRFDVKYRNRKAPTEVIRILAKHYTGPGMFHTTFFTTPFKCAREQLPSTLEYDSTLQKTRLGHFYLIVPRPLAMHNNSTSESSHRDDMDVEHKTTTKRGVIALDPGVRTFLTGYTSTGECVEWGKNDIQRLYRLGLGMDKLQRKAACSTTAQKRKRYRRAWHRMSERIRNLRLDFHHKCAKWLCSNFAVILLPTLGTTQMSNRSKRSISSTSVRKMLTWSHAQFRDRLSEKARQFDHTHVVVDVDEAYTSKTCGQCGRLHHKLGASKHFRCGYCDFEGDRDFNAARNILMKFMGARKNTESTEERQL
jgi:putative transposase